MPPIPITFDDGTKDTIEALERRQKDLRDFQIPRLRTCKGPLALQQQYAAEIREDVEGLARQVEALDGAVDDQSGERARKELRRVVDGFRASLASLKKDSRVALLASKRAIDAGSASNREELLRSSVVREKQDLNEKVAEDALMSVSNNVTEALQRTLVLMQGELEKSVLSTQLLDQSTASLKSASSTHDVLDSLMVTSKHLITALEKSDWLDRMLILAALLFFVTIVLFILKQRLVDRGIRIAFWWTRFIPASASKGAGRAAEKVVDAMERGAVSDVVGAASSVVAAAVTSTLLAVSSSVSASSFVPSQSQDLTSAHEPDPVVDVTGLISPTSSPEYTESADDATDLSATSTNIDVDPQSPIPTLHDEL